jgi:hypothetical protein
MVITDLLSAIMHYCHERSETADPNDVYYLDFERMVLFGPRAIPLSIEQ